LTLPFPLPDLTGICKLNNAEQHVNFFKSKEAIMSGSVYKFIEMVGTSPTSWEDAAKTAVETAAQSLRDTRVAEVKDLDMKIEEGKVVLYRATVKVSFKYQT
jgi:flavin-binding protein dodecin